MAVVVKPFPFAANGFTVVDLNVGDDRDFGAATDGLVSEGFVAIDGGKPAETKVDVIEENTTDDSGPEDPEPEASAPKKRGK